ncbi:MAG: transporter substrate-binding domain-containing protein [Nitrospinae bacterium]|nr:transporter substrate-binding domain-containing protein [Nitrospinota bacterium]
MRMFPAIMAVAAIAFFAPAGAADWKEGAKVRIATEGAYPPWNDTDASGKLVGFEIDLAADLCRRMKVTCRMIPRAWEGIIPALRAGEFDAIMSGMAITGKRKKLITYSRPFAASPHVFVVRAGGPLAGVSTKAASVTLGSLDAGEKAAIETLRRAFAGKKIGAQAGTVFVNFLRIHMADRAGIRTFKYQGDVDAALLAGRVDALFAQTSYLKPVLDKAKEKLKVVGPGFTGGSLGEGIGVGIRKEDRALADMFSKAITAAIEEGTLSRLSLKWFGFDLSAKE